MPLYTDIATGQVAAETDGSERPTLRAHGGPVHFVDAIITLTSALTTSDDVYLYKLPTGSRLLPELCSVDYEDPGDALTGDLGDSADADRYGAALALGNAAGRKNFSEAGTKGAAFLAPYKNTEETWLIFNPGTVTSPAATFKTVWHLAYTLG